MHSSGTNEEVPLEYQFCRSPPPGKTNSITSWGLKAKNLEPPQPKCRCRCKYTCLQSRYPHEVSELYDLHPWYWNSLFYSLISSRENSAIAHFATAIAISLEFNFFVPSGTYHCSVGRGSMEWDVCLTLLHMSSSGNGTRCICPWFKHIFFMIEHEKGLGRAKEICLALSVNALEFFQLYIYHNE